MSIAYRMQPETVRLMIENICRSITDDPDLSVKLTVHGGLLNFDVIRVRTTRTSSMSLLIGRQGRTKEALERVLAAISWRSQYPFRLAIEGPPKQSNRVGVEHEQHAE